MDRPPEDLTPSPDVGGRRPRDLALLRLAIGTGPPRTRARDQQADCAGGELLREVLNRLVALDPEPDAVAEALAQVVAAIGEPSGPTRGVCSLFLQEWHQTGHSPDAWGWLISEALLSAERGDSPRRRKGGGRDPS